MERVVPGAALGVDGVAGEAASDTPEPVGLQTSSDTHGFSFSTWPCTLSCVCRITGPSQMALCYWSQRDLCIMRSVSRIRTDLQRGAPEIPFPKGFIFLCASGASGKKHQTYVVEALERGGVSSRALDGVVVGSVPELQRVDCVSGIVGGIRGYEQNAVHSLSTTQK
jgi:hypothetical protein